jgi:hypothetical protein
MGTAMDLLGRRLSRTVFVLVLAPLLAASLRADDEKLVKRLEQLNSQLVKAFGDLAEKYDGLKDPEAAHLLASCAIGFGNKDPKLATIKGGWEVDLFVGKVRGGEVLADVNPIETALRGVANEYKRILEPLLASIKKGDVSAAAKALIHDSVPKYELARGAHEYIQATQRFNKLRRAMGLRAILWDFEASRQLILACWYMGETDDYREEDKSDLSSPLYTPAVELAKAKCHRPLYRKLREFPEGFRSYAFLRQDILNPNVRQLWLAHWVGGKKVDPMSAYAIPQLEYRQDIPTPLERYTRGTVVEAWPAWKDTEETVVVDGKKVPIVRYPHDLEQDVPPVFSNGRGAMEYGWAKSELDFLGKAGVPIMVRVFSRGIPSNIDVELKERAGSTIPVRIYPTGDSRVSFSGDWATILVVPERHLGSAASYTIRVSFKLGESGIDKSWSFKTGSK